MMSNDLVKITFSDATLKMAQGNVQVFITPELEEWMSKQKWTGGTQLALFKRGRGLRGLKHLIETIRDKKGDAKLIFNRKYSRETDGAFYINFHDYTKLAQQKFRALYRETGLDAAGLFLSSEFPYWFEYDENHITTAQMNKVNQNLPDVLSKVSKTEKNKRVVLKHALEYFNSLIEGGRIQSKDIESWVPDLRASSNIAFLQSKIDELKKRLNRKPDYLETAGKNSWQNWIRRNSWIFGARHRTLIEKQKVGFDSIPDYLFPTIDGFLDILEIKRPSHKAIVEDTSHAGSHIWSAKTNEAIGQVVTYLHEIELHQLSIQQKINEEYPDLFDESNLSVIKPRAFILIGRSNEWEPKEKRAFRELNYSLHGIEVLTYDDLLTRGQHIVDMYSKDFSGDGENL